MITQIRKKDKIIISVRHGVSSTCVKKKKRQEDRKTRQERRNCRAVNGNYVYYVHLKQAPSTRAIQEKQQEKC